MKEPIEAYLASKVLEDLRRGVRLPKELVLELTSYRYIDNLHGAVRPTDIPVLIDNAKSRNLPFSILAINLLKGFANRREVRKFFQDEWKKARSYEKRYALLWRLLDNEALPVPVHEQIFSFIKGNFARFKADIRKWFGGKEHVIEGCRHRLRMKRLPPTKRWVYLCCALAGDNSRAVMALIEEYDLPHDDFFQGVASYLRQQIKRAP
jgi:hypothetical protein